MIVLREFFPVSLREAETRDEIIDIASQEVPEALPLLRQQTGLDPGSADLRFNDWGELVARGNGRKFYWDSISNRWRGMNGAQ